MQQTQALDLLKMGKNVFLTGAAGAGKTYLLNQYIQYLKEHDVRVAVTASTGIAATHLQGNTLHSWSGIGVRDSFTNKDLEKLLTTPRIKRNYKSTKVLIIDEISMLHKHQLDMVDQAARYILDSEESFGGMQVVLCGDFFQLPPVSSSNNSNEEKQFAFEADAWETGDFYICYLDEQHRQGDDPLLTILNDIRSGTAGEHTKVPLRTRYKKEPEGATKPTRLYARNINVDVINEQELANISGETRTFAMQSQGFPALVEGLKKSCLALETLRLKIGSQVMFIKNSILGEYVNGTRAVVVGFSSKGWPVVKTYDSQTVTASPEDWNFEDNGVVRATITQIPLRLAWAITIHKSQGMTLDAAEMDLGDTFEPGMGYVALSRVRSLGGLKLMNLNEMALKVHPKILRHDSNFKDNSNATVRYLQKHSEDEKILMHRQTLSERFDGCLIAGVVESRPLKVRVKKEAAVPTHLQTLAMLKENMAVDAIAEKRGLSISTIITHIEKLKGLKQIENSHLSYFKNLIPQAEFDAIFAELQLSNDGQLKPVFDKLDGKYSYENIKVVRLFVG